MLISLVLIAAVINIIAKNHNYNIKIERKPDFDIRVRRDTKVTEEYDLTAEIRDEFKKILDVLLNPPDGNKVNDINYDHTDFDAIPDGIDDENGEVIYDNSIVKIKNDLRTQFLSELQNVTEKFEELKSDSKFTTHENIRNNVFDMLKSNGTEINDSNYLKEIIDSLQIIIDEYKSSDILNQILKNCKNTSPFTDDEFEKLLNTLKSLENNAEMDNEKRTLDINNNKVTAKLTERENPQNKIKRNITMKDISIINRSKRHITNNTVVKYIVNTYNKIYNYFRPSNENDNNNYELSDNNSVERSQAYSNVDNSVDSTVDNTVVEDTTTTETILAGCITCFNLCPSGYMRLGFMCVKKRN